MDLAIALFPIALVLVLVGLRASMLAAGVIGAIGSAIVVYITRGQSVGALQVVLQEGAKGAWLGGQAASVVVGGMMFYLALQRWSSTHPGQKSTQFSQRRLWLVCFLVGPFIESATGYGVGGVVALSVISGMGLRGVDAVVLSLLSQILVPWGALAVGMYVGSGITHIPAMELSYRTAVMILPVLWIFQVHFWLTLRRLGQSITMGQICEDGFALSVFCCTLLIATRYLAPEVALFVAAGVPLVAKWMIDERPTGATIKGAAMRALPYIILCALLVVTRVWSPLAAALRSVGRLTPFPDVATFSIFYSAAFWLIACATVFALAGASPGAPRRFLRQSWTGAWRPAAVTLCFITMAQLLIAAQAPNVIGASLKGAFGSYAVLLAPAIGSGAGLVTGSNATAVAMFMAIVVDMGKALPVWTAALQNVAGSTFTLLSPVRVSKVCAMAELPGGERAVYRHYAVTALVVQGVLLLEAFALTL